MWDAFRSAESLRACNCSYQQASDTVSERLRRWTRNPLGSARRGSNPLGVAFALVSKLSNLLCASSEELRSKNPRAFAGAFLRGIFPLSFSLLYFPRASSLPESICFADPQVQAGRHGGRRRVRRVRVRRRVRRRRASAFPAFKQVTNMYHVLYIDSH